MADDSITVIDRKVIPKRIVSLSPSNTEILFAVGAAPKIVGVTDYCNYPDELQALIETGKIERVGGYWNPSLETIVNLKPDLVLVSTAVCNVKTNKCKKNCSRSCELTTKVASQLMNFGLNVLILAPHSLNDVLENILLVGNVTGNGVQAINILEKLQQRIDSVVTKSKTISNRPKVYFEVWNNPYISVNSRTWIGHLINLAGGTNIFGEAVSEWPVVLPEEIIQRDPDLMVFPVIPDFPRFWGSYEAVKKRQGWSTITAVKNRRLHEIPRDFISRPGPRLVEALELLEKMIPNNS
jgi:iron complex transport system substrate-binding protein